MANLISFSITPESCSSPKGTDIWFKAFGLFSDGSIQDITELCEWGVTDEDIITINNTDNKGKVFCLNEGSAQITAFCNYITSDNKPIISVESAIFSNWEILPSLLKVITAGDNSQLEINAVYSDGSKQLRAPLYCSSSNEQVASITNDGVITAISPGQTSFIITMINDSGKNQDIIESCIVQPYVGITYPIWKITPENMCTVNQNSTIVLTVSVYYKNGSYSEVLPDSVFSSNEDIATISLSNNTISVNGINPGETILTLNVTDPDSGIQYSLTENCITLPYVPDQLIQKNYITNGQFQKFNDYIIPDTGRINISYAVKTYPFYVTGKEKVVINSSVGSFPNEYPNFGKILFYKTGEANGIDYFLINTISSDLPIDTAQYAGLHYCADYHSSNPSERWWEYPCASITEFNNENVKIKASFANVGESNITIDIYYRQYYSDIDDYYVACPISLVLLPSADTDNPEILNLDETINIQAVDHTKITKNSFFSFVFKVTCDGNNFVLGFTNIGLFNTINKNNIDIDSVNNSFKSYQLPSISCISDISRIGNVLTLLSDTNRLGNYVTYNRPTLEYKSILPVGTILAYEGSGSYSNSYNAQSLVTDGFLFLNGVTISRTRFQKLFSQQCQHSTTVPLYGWGNDGHITAVVANAIYPGYAKITVPLTYPPSGTTAITGLSGFTAPPAMGTDTFYDTYIGCPSGKSIYNDIINGGGYITFYATNNVFYIIFVVNNVIVMPYITTMLKIDINQTNIVYVNITDTMSSAEVTNALVSACNPLSFAIGDYRGIFLRNCDLGANIDPDAASRTSPFGGIASAPGSYQTSAMTTHTHGHTISVSVDLTTADVKTKASSGSMLGPSIDYNTSTNFDYHKNLLGITSSPAVTSSLTIANSGTSTESRPPNIYTNYIIKF